MSHYKTKIIELSAFEIRDVKIEVRSQAAAQTPAANSNVPAAKSVKLEVAEEKVINIAEYNESIGSRIDPRYNFASFVVASSNELAVAAAKRVAESGYDAGFNPLFLHSGVGLGKTHLMHAIANYSAEKHPERKVIYLSAEKFLHQYVRSLRERNIMEFKEKLRSADILMIDDFQFIAGKESTQEEFFHTLTALVEGGKQLVISCDRAPSAFENLPERMRSRLASGLVADIHNADYALRMQILQSKALAANVVIPQEVLEFLANKITSNIRELEGALNRIIARTSLVKTEVTLESAKTWLSDLLNVKEKQITVEEIQTKVAEQYNIKTSEIISSSRKQDFARPRQIAMYIAKMVTTKSLADIGKYFGGKDHTTVIHACKKVEEMIATNTQLEAEVNALISKIKC
jgi:chromosomal replication initiator protein